ncbi:Imm8 family immunity protein [Arthrobacter sp. NPDC056493]|uniref:Imm8 family immunity protein n=1 Tax=Arthrobacter sp. NPDC056493 TaxID=3345839 RepID=UPI0036714186
MTTLAPDFPTLLAMYVSSRGQAAVLRYEVAVTTIDELTLRMNFQPCVAGHGQVIVAKFDRRNIESFLRSAVAQVSAESWGELDLALERFGRSEFSMSDTYWSPDPWEAPGRMM